MWRFNDVGRRAPGFSAILALALIACRHGQVTPPETDTDDSVVEDTESGDSEEPGPCGPGTPTDCVEVIDGVCWAPGPLGAADAPDDFIERKISAEISGRCGYVDFHACGDLFSQVDIQEPGQIANGNVWLYESPNYTIPINDLNSRALVGIGIVDATRGQPACKLMYRGDPVGIPCFKSAVDRVNANFEGCDSSSCDPCVCRVNEVTEARYPGCEVAEESTP